MSDHPAGFELLRDVGSELTRFEVESGLVRHSDRVIFGLLTVAVMSPLNTGQSVPSDYHLNFDGEVFPIGDWWGRATEFSAIQARKSVPLGTYNFGDRMNVTC